MADRECLQLTALAAVMDCPPGRRQKRHEDIIWHNFCDAFEDEQDFRVRAEMRKEYWKSRGEKP